MTDALNALVLFSNFVLIPASAYGAQLALGALGVTLIYAILRFANFAHHPIYPSKFTSPMLATAVPSSSFVPPDGKWTDMSSP